MLAEYYRSPDRFLNVLYLDDDPTVAARAHSDRHLSKALVDATQILSAAWLVESLKAPEAEWGKVFFMDWDVPRKDTPFLGLGWLHARLCGNRIHHTSHTGHPCVGWATLYGGNYAWLYQLGCALLEEYKFRFDRLHACGPVVRALELLPPPLLDTAHQYCESPSVLPSELILSDSAIDNYMLYCRKTSPALLSYTGRKPPQWIADIANYKEA